MQVNNFVGRCSHEPGNPLNYKITRSLRFSLKFMEEFAKNRRTSLTFRGLVYENSERPEIRKEFVKDINIQQDPFYWKDTEKGFCVCMSLVDLRDACPDQLLEEAGDGLRALADQFGYDIVGVPATKNDEALFDEYRQGSCGSLRQREWENSGIKFKPPAKESDHCFFVANASAPDQEQEPRFVWRSAATLRVEL